MKTVSLFFFVLLSLSLMAQEEKVHSIETPIASMIVYLDGAEITRHKQLTLVPGRNRLIFKDISPKIDPRSIRVATDENVSVLSISSKTDHLTKVEEKPRIKQVRDSLRAVEKAVSALLSEQNAFETEKNMLLENTKLGGTQKGTSAAELKAAADFYRQRIGEINSRLAQIVRQTQQQNQTKTKLQAELTELNASLKYKRTEITILLSAKQRQSAEVEVKYLVNQAGWAPSYDIRALDTDNPVQLIYRAKVFNNTDIDWKNVKLKLSTGDPKLSAAKPELKPWYLKFYTPSQNKGNYYQRNQMPAEGYVQNMAVSDDELSQSLATGGSPGGSTQYREVQVAALSAEFDIEEPYSIPADDKPYLVDVVEYELPASYKHFAVTKLDRDVFLLARITGWEDLNLVEGPANIYFGGSYIGKSYISTRNVKDTLDLSLGRDNKVIVTRTKLKEYSSTKLIGSKRKETLAYEMIAKNNRKSPITLEILDQVPISQNSEIAVDVAEISGAEHNPNTGQLKWHYTLKPGESRKINLRFEIKHPKNTEVKVKTSRTKQMRMF